MPDDDRPGPAFNAAARKRGGLEALFALLDRDLMQALKTIAESPEEQGKCFYTEMQTSGNDTCRLSIFYADREEVVRRQDPKYVFTPHPEVRLIISRKEDVFSFEVTDFNISRMNKLAAVFRNRPWFPRTSTHDFSAAREALRQHVLQLNPKHQARVNDAFLSLTSIILCKPLRLKTSAPERS
jgi:hypothetical protein